MKERRARDEKSVLFDFSSTRKGSEERKEMRERTKDAWQQKNEERE